MRKVTDVLVVAAMLAMSAALLIGSALAPRATREIDTADHG